MKLLCYRGAFYEYARLSLKEEMVGQIERSRHLQPKTVSQSVQVLCDARCVLPPRSAIV